jgi:hypothetical protein
MDGDLANWSQIATLKNGRGLCNQDAELLEPKIVETEKVLNGLIRALRERESE